MLTELANACRDSERLRFAYRDHGGTATRRTVEPHRLVCTERRWYLVAWDVDRDDWRTFRADRIEPKPPHGPRFPPREPPADDLAAYVSKGVSGAAYATEVTVRLFVPLDEAAAIVGPMDGVLEPEGEGSCLLRAGAHNLQVAVVHVMLMGLDFEVIEPPELTERVRELRDRLSRALDRTDRRTDGRTDGRMAGETPGGS